MNAILRAPMCGLIGLPFLALGGARRGAGQTNTQGTIKDTAAGKALGAPLFEHLGDYHHPVTTTSKDAQRYFDQGLTLTYAFNHPEAIRSYTEAARLDPKCAMAWWGVALSSGPQINQPM